MGVFQDHCGARVLTVLVAVMAVTMAKTQESTNGEAKTPQVMGNCTCGGFATETPEEGAEPLLSQTPLSVPCTPDGEHTCRSMCVALATATKAKGPQILCARLGNATELKFAAFSKACSQPWSYSGLRADEPLCCADSQVTVCPSAAAAPPADTTAADTL